MESKLYKIMLADMALLAEILEELHSAYENGDGEYQAVYGRMAEEKLNELKKKYPELDNEMNDAHSNLWKDYYSKH